MISGFNVTHIALIKTTSEVSDKVGCYTSSTVLLYKPSEKLSDAGCCRKCKMSSRRSTKQPEFCLVYFFIDKTVCVVPRKKVVTNNADLPMNGTTVSVNYDRVLYQALLVSSGGKFERF